MGRGKKAYWRIGAFDAHTRRDGRPMEYLGSYDPHLDEPAKNAQLKRERIEHWLSVGAKPSETVASILKKQGIKC